MCKAIFRNVVSFVGVLVFAAVLLGLGAAATQAKPKQRQLMTRWAKEVSAGKVHPEYPRPQMVRKEWMSLNGEWEYAICAKEMGRPGVFDGTILVPFCAESALSGVQRQVGADNRLWYRRSFSVPREWSDRRILLHFGAVDWEATVWVNGKEVGSHRGGYDPFSFDITDRLKKDGAQEIVLAVWDPVNEGYQARGKQVQEPKGIWYTSVTGIWQSVWLEPVNEAHIRSLRIVSDIDGEQVRVAALCSNTTAEHSVEVAVKDGWFGKAKSEGLTGHEIVIPVTKPKLWSPDSPFLYDLKVVLKDGKGKKVDEVGSYFGMRKIALGRDKDGIMRMMLNNEFVFQFGLLDQGWWPDGLYTAPTDEALRYDIEVSKNLGLNLARKHVKIEPQRWYYWCDKLGLLVWQDMPSGDEYISRDEPDIERSEESAEQFRLELKRLIYNFGNHPSIIVWVPYNEGWGQYDTGGITKMIKELDPTRLVNSASGWTDRGTGDIHDIHAYPGPVMPEPEAERAIVLGEFGGLGLPIEGHTWQERDNWGYRNYKTRKELTDAYGVLIKNLYPMVKKGLSAAVYTQTTDVEIEVNGMMTYDRAIVKMDTRDAMRINQGYLPPFIESENDIFIDSAQIEMFNVGKGDKIRYTLDGSEPDQESKLYTKPVTIMETTTIKARTFWLDGCQSSVSEHTCSKVGLREPQSVYGLKPGLRYKYFEDAGEKWDRLPDFEQLSAKALGIAAKCDLSYAQRHEWFGLEFEGFVKVLNDGIYRFYTDSDDGSKLYIGSRLVVDNDYNHAMSEKSGQIALKAGTHPVKVMFFQGMGGRGLEVLFEGPGVEKQQIGPELLFHAEVK
ncbi:MAG: sugar-binding domain-containing protein [Planctomycetota bacterium]|jgi:hypothetical protein